METRYEQKPISHRLSLTMRATCPSEVTVIRASLPDRVIVRYPNCSNVTVQLYFAFLDLRNRSIQIVSSLPRNVDFIDLSHNPVKVLNWPSGNAIKRVALDNCRLQNLSSMSSLQQLQNLSARENRIQSLSPLHAIPTLRHISAAKNNISELNQLPPFLNTLDLSANAFQKIVNYSFPRELFILNLSHNKALKRMENNIFAKSCDIDLRNVSLDSTPTIAKIDTSHRQLSALPPRKLALLYACTSIAIIFLVFSIYLLYRYLCHIQRHHRHLSPLSLESGSCSPMDSDNSSQWRKSMKLELPIRTRKFSIQNMLYRVAFSNSEILKVRIPSKNLRATRTLSCQNPYITFQAELQKRNSRQLLAVKQLCNCSKADQASIQTFVQEIDRCFKLRHPNLVPFVGVVWDYWSNLAYTCEYIKRGSLMTLLAHIRTHKKQQGFRWYPLPSLSLTGTRPPARSTLDLACRSKLEYVFEIVQGLLYLHSRHTTAESEESIYQDFSSKAVLLDDDFTVLLSLFGIYKSMSLENMLSNKATTTPWIAPEVLKCHKSDEKATVYSLGVIMTELDTCEYPYKTGIGELLPAKSSNARIAMMVGANMVQPNISAECPSDIRSMIKCCLEYEKEERLTLRDIHSAIVELLRTPSAV